uniref:RHS repeat domain-containing protein n=1 Tax=Flexithrix dorotheae TaxID=70993 RepID=UPI002481245A
FGMNLTGIEKKGSPDHKFQYNGKEKQEDFDLNWYDYGWRNYDPALGRWHGVDGMSEKYVSYSPYHYAGNNPIRNYDIDGNEFTESGKKWAEKIWDYVKKQMDKNNAKMSKKMNMITAGVNKKGKMLSSKRVGRLANQISKLQDKNGQLNAVTNEIIAMDNSEQVYNVIESPSFNGDENSPDKAAAMYNMYTGAVDIILPGSSKLNLAAHEYKHAFQFESGSASLTVYPGGKNFNTLSPLQWLAYDQQDEIEAYKRQGMFGSTHSSLPSGYTNRSINGINFPKSQNTMQPYSNSPHAVLQELANKARQAFRLNGTTYAPKK